MRWNRYLLILVIVAGCCSPWEDVKVAWAQTGLSTLQATSPAAISPIQPSSAPTSGLPANVLTPSTTSQLAPNTGARLNSGPPPFTSAGRGLPGMQGGPPLNAPMGAQDPSRSYMQPPTVGPLFCDPALNIQC